MRRPWLVRFIPCVALLGAPPLAAQAPDTTCLRTARVATDSVAKLHLSSTVLTLYQVRNLRRLDSLHTARCVGSVPVPPPDTVVPPPPVDTVIPPPPPPPIDTTTTPSAGGFVGPAELPRSVPQFPASLATASCTQTIPATGLQAAVGAARAGDVLCLTPGDRFRGTLRLPARADSGWVVVRTAPTPGQPAPGARVRPAQGPTLATLEAIGASPTVVASPGAHGWYLGVLEVRTDSALTALTYTLVDLPAPPSLTQFARDLVFDRVWMHGWPTRELRRCVSMQSAATTIIESWLDDCHEKGSDSQAIASWAGPGPFRIENNTLAGSTETVMFGGADPAFPGVHPCDVTLRRNHIFSPLSWKGVWPKKHLLELKNVCRLLAEDNVFDGAYASANTYAILLKSTNQGGTATHRDQHTRDVTIRHNLIVRSAGAIAVNGFGGNPATDSVTRRVAILENVADSLGGAYGFEPRGVMFLSNARDVLFQRNTWLSPAGQGSAYTVGNASEGQAVRLTIDGDVRTRGAYGMMGCWSCAAPPASLRLVLLGAPQTTLPGVAFAPDLAAAIALGYGVSRATIDAAVRGVVVQP